MPSTIQVVLTSSKAPSATKTNTPMATMAHTGTALLSSHNPNPQIIGSDTAFHMSGTSSKFSILNPSSTIFPYDWLMVFLLWIVV